MVSQLSFALLFCVINITTVTGFAIFVSGDYGVSLCSERRICGVELFLHQMLFML